MTPLLEEALKTINSSVNVTTGLTHSNDKSKESARGAGGFRAYPYKGINVRT